MGGRLRQFGARAEQLVELGHAQLDPVDVFVVTEANRQGNDLDVEAIERFAAKIAGGISNDANSHGCSSGVGFDVEPDEDLRAQLVDLGEAEHLGVERRQRLDVVADV